MHMRSMSRFGYSMLMATTLAVALSVLTSFSPKARAQPISPSQISKGPNEFSFHLGGQAQMWGWAPGGFKLYFEYARNLGDDFWLDFQINPVFGDRWADDRNCWREPDGDWVCDSAGYYEGTGIEFFGGVKWKFFPFRLPFMLYAKAGGTVVFLSWYRREGAAFAARGGGGFKYFFTENFGAGAEANMDLGFCFVEDTGLEGYASFDFGVGLEVLF